MRSPQYAAPLLIAAAFALLGESAPAQQKPDSSATSPDSAQAAAAAYPWRDSVRYGGGPSVGAPPSDYTGAAPPARWCLRATGRPPGDFGISGGNWTEVSRSWLRQVLSDTTHWGAGWRKVLGGAPGLAPRDSIIQVMDTPEVASTAAGATLLSVMSCVNGTGGCGQEFLRRYPDGRWAPVWQVWLDQLPDGFSGRILHGVRIDPRTLAGTAGFYGPRDPNCCPAEELRFQLALRGDSLALSRYAVVPSP